jgi:hypothetical protein
MTVNRTFGLGTENEIDNDKIKQYINLKLASIGCKVEASKETEGFLEVAKPLLNNYREKARLLSNHFSPSGKRIHDFLDDYLKEVRTTQNIKLPQHTFILDRHGLGRVLSLPSETDFFETSIIKPTEPLREYLNNPKEDRGRQKVYFMFVRVDYPSVTTKRRFRNSRFATCLMQH